MAVFAQESHDLPNPPSRSPYMEDFLEAIAVGPKVDILIFRVTLFQTRVQVMDMR